VFVPSPPKDYRWCGYAEAAGGGRLAREGLRAVVEARQGNSVAPNRVMAQYRTYLFESGKSVEAGAHGEKRREGFSAEQIQETLAAGGEIKLSEAIHCRIRYFNDGMILGSRAFVNGVFESHRAWFGKKRKTGARRMRGIQAPGLFVALALEVRLYG
jgi:putative transposase